MTPDTQAVQSSSRPSAKPLMMSTAGNDDDGGVTRYTLWGTESVRV